MSHERLCEDCGDKRRRDNWHQLMDHKGPWFLHWRRRIVASAGGMLVDDLQAPR